MSGKVAPTSATRTPWGDESKLFKPPQNVRGEDSWIVVIGFWLLLLPINLWMILLGAFSDSFFRTLGGLCITSVKAGSPIYLAWVWWWYSLALVVRLLRNGGSRFALFNSSQQIFGGNDYWWHGQGAWNYRYDFVRQTMESDQSRGNGFGAAAACVPEIFPTKLLLFESGPRYHAFRARLIEYYTDRSRWSSRIAELPAVLAPLAPEKMSAAALKADRPRTDMMVTVAVWFLLFGVKLTEGQATTMAAWGAGPGGLAGYFIFPRLIHRIFFNFLLNRVVKLRESTLGVMREQKLEQTFDEFNEGIPAEYRAPELCQVADELAYAVNFAGVGGTQHGVQSVISALAGTTVDVPADTVAFPAASKLAPLYRESPEKFIYESLRLDAPVTSATCRFKADTTVRFAPNCCKKNKPIELPKGTMLQYVLSMANRDVDKWGPTANDFDPKRAGLEDLVVWNGALSAPDKAPRFCPGQQLSVEVIKAIVSNFVTDVQ